MTTQNRSAAEICQNVDLNDEAAALLSGAQTEAEFSDLLTKKKLHADAIRFMAQRLPKRSAVWWGILCLWETYKPEPPEPTAAVLRAAVDWIKDGVEAKRRTLEKVGVQAGEHTPAGMLALAAFASGGSLAPASAPEVSPAPHLTGKLVAVALLQAAHVVQPQQATHRLRQFLSIGRDVLAGRATWTTES